jgi:SAM-dependent methyltransferase
LNCDRIARWYRWLEYAAFGGALRRRREAFMFDLPFEPKNVLVLGDGDGRFLQLFAALHANARIEAIDVSEGMTSLAQRRVVSENVVFRIEDARTAEFAPSPYDIAIAHFFFDCFSDDEVRTLLARIPARSWIISEFRNTRWSGLVLRALYFFFRLTTGLEARVLPDHRKILESLGFAIEKEQSALGGLLVSEIWTRVTI